MPKPELESLQRERVLYLTTVGRKSGLPRTIEIWFVIYQRHLYILAERRLRAQWVRNIQANPAVSIRIKGRRFMARGRILDNVQDRHTWQEVAGVSRQKYGWGDGLPVAFEVLQEEKADDS